MGGPFDTENLGGNSRTTTIRAVLFMVIMGTLPFYILGFALWATAPDPDAPDGEDTIDLTQPTNTPLGQGDDLTEEPTLRPTSTPFPTLPPLDDTPEQFIPIRPTFRPTNTQVIIPTSTPFPTFTPLPTNTPLPTEPPPPTLTPLPPASDTPTATGGLPPVPPPPTSDGGGAPPGDGSLPPFATPPPPDGG